MRDCLIDQTLEKLVNKYGTRDPFKLAKEMNIPVLIEDLGEIYGYYNKIKRIQMIHLNSRSSERKRLYTCAHELGHAICHPDENTPQLSVDSIVSELKIEKEANYFATNLLIDGSHEELERPTKFEILDYYGLPWYLDQYVQ